MFKDAMGGRSVFEVKAVKFLAALVAEDLPSVNRSAAVVAVIDVFFLLRLWGFAAHRGEEL